MRALEPLGNEHVGHEVAAAALDRIVVTAEAGIGIRAAGAGEGGIDADLASGGDDRLRRVGAAGAVFGREFGLEKDSAALDQRGQGGRAGGGDRVEIEMRRKDALLPTAAERRADGAGANHGAQNGG